jgi:hypothetical protein
MGSDSKTGTVQIEGVDYRWSVYRQPAITSTRGLVGLTLLVETMESGRRSLILEFAIDPKRHGDMPHHQRFRVPNHRLIECIQNAMNSGWDPDSRGKDFVFNAGPVNPN